MVVHNENPLYWHGKEQQDEKPLLCANKCSTLLEMTQLLKRQITVKGENTITENVPVVYPYSNFEELLTTSLPGMWSYFTATQAAFEEAITRDQFIFYRSGTVWTTEAVATSSDLAAALGGYAGLELGTVYYLGGSPQAGVILPFPYHVVDDVPFTFRIHGPTDDDYLEGTVSFIARRYQSLLADRVTYVNLFSYALWVEDAVVQHGAVFDIGENLNISLGLDTDIPVSESTKQVWAQLSERGADLGLVVGDFGGQGVEGAQERIEARVRYDPAIAIGKEFTDDLGRRWLAVSTRTTEDRRYLVYEGVRLVSGIDLPEFGVGE